MTPSVSGPVVAPVLQLAGATMGFGDHALWSDLDLSVGPGEFVTVLGSNGSGKSSLLKAILGLQRLNAGSISMLGRPVKRGDRRIGYIPQQRLIASGTPMRGRDLVGLGIDGHRWGPRVRRRAVIERRVREAISSVQAEAFADRPVGLLSGGEQQRLRVAQALVAEPALLLCDEPLISLDLHHQREVSRLVDERRRTEGTPVLFVTHDVNPVLPMTDRVLYFAGGRYRLGSPDEVLRSDVLSDLYGTSIDVAQVHGRVVVLGAPDHQARHHAEDDPELRP